MVHQNTIELLCFAYGNPAPDLKWYKDGVLVRGEESLYDAPKNILLEVMIRNPNCTHIGKYVCKAENELGTAESPGKSITADGNQVEHTISCFLTLYHIMHRYWAS